MAVIALGAACGGSVVFVEDDDGAGGSGGTTSSSSTKSSGTVSTTKGSSVVTAVTTNDAVTVVSGVTTGGQFCEFGQPTPQCDDCIQDSIQGPCQPAFDQCFNDPECEAYGNCLGDCQGSGACCQSCDSQFPPQIVAAYTNLLACVFCNVCNPQCAGVVPGLCDF